MKTKLGAVSVTAVLALSTLGCTTKPQAPEAVVEDKVFAVTPASEQVKAGIMTGEMADMKVTERVEKGSGRVEAPPHLTATLKLKNSSTDQSASAIAGTIRYIGMDGTPIALEDQRSNLSISSNPYGSGPERLDPGQETTRSVDVDFPASGLEPKKLKEIRLELTYLPSAYKDETVDLPVAIAAGK